ncbi:hypothetical protein SAMN06265365_11498 [Tistlia consotensis]|uniref:DUF3558 domain-containing protein n=1 Tax=Tistlia consotensis USBA 355 TaxID=560819 RepID=A0A1Y6BDP5_9PROT|nr:hypothetical protein [Tistlia consotensis]SME99320.1 hypothetical protein SAMN05428998_102265 [Tistlia consotensis USBA 355]SNR77075.1 hypothetical protein SAMN06265365_11498 [Tistlia consotensis]
MTAKIPQPVPLRSPLAAAALGASLLLAVLPAVLPGAPAAAAALDACSLVDPAAAAKILGHPVTPKPVDSAAAGNDASLCSYQGGGLHGGFLLIAAPLRADDLAATVDAQKKSVLEDSAPPGVPLPKPTIVDLPDLGDAAFLVTTDDNLQLHVFAAGDKLVLDRNLAPSPAAIDQAEALARAAIKGLK